MADREWGRVDSPKAIGHAVALDSVAVEPRELLGRRWQPRKHEGGGEADETDESVVARVDSITAALAGLGMRAMERNDRAWLEK